MIPEQEKRMLEALERIADAYPAKEDLLYYPPGTDTVNAGTALTVTFTWRKDFAIRVKQMYCDNRASCTFSWRFAGATYAINEIEYPFAKRAMEDDYETVVLTISNAGLSNVDIGYFITGFARKKET